jgi:hypothetical protein
LWPFQPDADRIEAYGFTSMKRKNSRFVPLVLFESITARGCARQTRREHGKFAQAAAVAASLPLSSSASHL